MSSPLHLDVFVVPYKPITGLIPPMSKGEPNNGFLVGANGYRVLDTDKTDKVLTFDIELTLAMKGK